MTYGQCVWEMVSSGYGGDPRSYDASLCGLLASQDQAPPSGQPLAGDTPNSRDGMLDGLLPREAPDGNPDPRNSICSLPHLAFLVSASPRENGTIDFNARVARIAHVI